MLPNKNPSPCNNYLFFLVVSQWGLIDPILETIVVKKYHAQKQLGRKGFVLTLKPRSITEACQGRNPGQEDEDRN